MDAIYANQSEGDLFGANMDVFGTDEFGINTSVTFDGGPVDLGLGDGTLADAGPGEEGLVDQGPGEPSEACLALKHGFNTNFAVDGQTRGVALFLPDGVEDGGPWPVIVAWHGFGDMALTFGAYFSGQVNNADMPHILVVSESSGNEFLEWSILESYDGP